MGRPKEYRQRLKYQVASARKKTLDNQLAARLTSELGMSEVEARLLAHRLSLWIQSRPGLRGPNQILIDASVGRDRFVRKWRVGKKIRVTPYDAEDLDLELEFGLATMQTGRILRLIEEAYQQDGLLSAKQLTLHTNITPTSLRNRLREVRELGIWAPVRGLSRKDRARAGIMRSTWILKRYLEGQPLHEVRKVAAISRQRLGDLLRRIASVNQQLTEGSFEAQDPEEAQWAEVIANTSRNNLVELLPEPVKAGQAGSWAELRAELEADFALSPVKLRALRELTEETIRSLSDTRTAGEVIYWAVAAEEPAGKPLDSCRLVPAQLTLFDPRDIELSDRDLNRLTEIKFHKVARLAAEAKQAGGYLTYADLSYLLGVHPAAVRGLIRKNPGVIVPLRGLECDIGRGVSHRKKVIELYLQMHTETEIVSRTGHSYAAVENYIKEFAAVLMLSERGLSAPLIRRVTGRSMKLVMAYLELVREYSGPEYSFRLHHLRKIFLAHEPGVKKNFRGERP